MASLIRATNLWGFDELVRQRGADPLPLLRKYHFPPEQQRADNAFLVYRHFVALIEETADLLAFPDFGLRLAQFQGLDILGPISVIARSAATVGEAVDSIGRYLHLHSPAIGLTRSVENVITDTGSVQRIRFEFIIDDEQAGAYGAQSYELSLSNSMQVFKLLCGNSFRPYSVHFRHARLAAESVYREVFDCTPYFKEDWCGFYLPLAAFEAPLSSADHQTWQLAEKYLASQQAPNATSLSEDVLRLISSLLPTGKCSGEVIASHLSMHQRTLQRRLAREGVTYEQLLNEERRKMARHYLMEPNLMLSQIAGLLGYSEQSAFNRACRDWFGVTPRQYRKQLTGSGRQPSTSV